MNTSKYDPKFMVIAVIVVILVTMLLILSKKSNFPSLTAKWAAEFIVQSKNL